LQVRFLHGAFTLERCPGLHKSQRLNITSAAPGSKSLGKRLVGIALAASIATFCDFMRSRLLLRLSFVAILVALLDGCEELPPEIQQSLTGILPMGAPPGYWHDQGVGGPPKIVVHLEEQKAFFYRGKILVGESTVSTGKRGFSTPPGRYRVVAKDRNHVSSEFGDYVDDYGNVVKSNIDVRKDSRPPHTHFDGARMPYCMHFNGGYAMHEGYVPPFAASHGCIRLPHGMAEHFFDNAPEGTPVIVKQ
jgi:L,D-transpeptidase catalytic domain